MLQESHQSGKSAVIVPPQIYFHRQPSEEPEADHEGWQDQATNDGGKQLDLAIGIAIVPDGTRCSISRRGGRILHWGCCFRPTLPFGEQGRYFRS